MGTIQEDRASHDGFAGAAQEMRPVQDEEDAFEENVQNEYEDAFDEDQERAQEWGEQHDLGEYPQEAAAGYGDDYHIDVGEGDNVGLNEAQLVALENETTTKNEDVEPKAKPAEEMVHRRKDNGNSDNDEDDYDYRPRSKDDVDEDSCFYWVCKISQEIGFSLWFRVYVTYLLFCNLTFVCLFGYHYMLAFSYRMLVPPTDKQFLVSFAFMCAFWVILTLTSSFIWLNIRLTMSWFGMARTSCNVFFLPNTAEDEATAIRVRDYQLLLLEFVLLFLPLLYGILQTVQGSEPVYAFAGHFSFSGFVIFQIVVAAIWLFFWYRSLCTKRSMWNMGARLRAIAKEKEKGLPRGNDYSSDSGESYSRRSRRRRRDEEDSYDSAESEEDRRSRRKRHRRDSDHGRRSDYDARSHRSRRSHGRRPPRDPADDPIPWHRRVLSNPYVMAEFGADLYSAQAYFVHIITGLAWVLVSSYPMSVSVDNIAWLAIIIAVLIGGIVMLWQRPSKTKAKKVAERQRRMSFAFMILWTLFCVVSIISALATITYFGIALVIGLVLNQFFAVRRHDMHVRTELEGGAFHFPITNTAKFEERRRAKRGAPPEWIPLLPCGNVWSVFFDCCIVPEARDPSGDKKIFTSIPPGHELQEVQLNVPKSIAGRDGRLDKIVRPGVMPGFLLPGEKTPFAKPTHNDDDREYSATQKPKLSREVYLNRRERVVTSDAMVTTWYFFLYLIVLGMAYGFGDWTAHEGLVATPQVVEDVSYPGSRPYAACHMRWGPSGALTLQDFALLSYISDADDATKEIAMAKWFSSPEKTLQHMPAASARGTSSYLDKRGAPVAWEQYNGTVAGTRAYIIVVGEAAFGRAWMRDVDTWGEAAGYQVLSAVNPLFAAWNYNAQMGFIDFLGMLKKTMKGTNELSPLETHVRDLLATGAPVYLTGHGTHGGWAKILAQKLGGQVPVVTFGSPGVQWTAERFGVSSLETLDEVSFVPRDSLLSRIDMYTGYVQEATCDGTSMTACQSMPNMLCDILRSCGDEHGRYFAGFPEPVAGDYPRATCDMALP